MARVYNFSAGPAVLPEAVLKEAAAEMLDYGGTGMGVMEMSHRSKAYQNILDTAEADLRSLMGIPENYKVLFLQGGASQQFAMVPLNLLKNGADYAVTGEFSGKAYKEAQKFGKVHLTATGEANHFTRIPSQDELVIAADSDYLHICANNTIYGTTWPYIPQVDIPVVADMSSCILSEPVDVSRYGMIYAGAQKNMAPAGLTVAIIRKDLITEPQPITPTMLNYGVHAKAKSMYNTPPCYQIYILGLVLEWLESIGGLTGIEKINRNKAGILYDYLDNSSYFTPIADKGSRSMMNVTFKAPTVEADEAFVKATAAAGFSNLKGHRAVGHMRASIYNAMPTEGVEKLVEFMKDFEKNA